MDRATEHGSCLHHLDSDSKTGGMMLVQHGASDTQWNPTVLLRTRRDRKVPGAKSRSSHLDVDQSSGDGDSHAHCRVPFHKPKH